MLYTNQWQTVQYNDISPSPDGRAYISQQKQQVQEKPIYFHDGQR